MSDFFQIGATIGGTLAVAAGLFAGWTKVSKAKDDKLEASKMETIQVLTSNRDAWKAKYDDEHNDFKAYREHTHLQIDDANAKLLKCTEENVHLKIKTDVTPMMDLLFKMTRILEAITERLNIQS
jgi:hypothetical protein